MNLNKNINLTLYNMKQMLLLLVILISVFFGPNIHDRRYIGIFIIMFFFLINLNNITFKKDKVACSLFIYIIFTIIIDLINLFIYSNGLVDIIKIFIYNFIPIIAYFSGILLNKKINKYNFSKIIIFIFSLIILVGILQVFFSNFRELSLKLYANYEKYSYNFSVKEYGRAIGSIGNPNSYGILVSIMLLFLINDLVTNRNRIKSSFFKIVLIFPSVFVLLLTQSRTAIISFLISMIYLIFKSINSKKIFKSIIIIILMLIPFLFFIYIIGLGSNRFTSTGFANLGGRVPIWINTFNFYFKNNLNKIFLGYGQIFIESTKSITDNYYLLTMYRYGIVGLILYINVFLKLYNSKRDEYYKSLIKAIIILILISDFTGAISGSITLVIFIFLLFGYTTNLNNSRR